MSRSPCHVRFFVLGAVAVLAAGCESPPQERELPDRQFPEFQVDPTWPKPLPNDWIMGPVTGLFVDGRDHIWVVHQTAGERVEERLSPQEIGAAQDPPIAECCFPAPPVIEFDPEGNVVQAWGGPGDGYHWPTSEHGVFVDDEDAVWVGGYSHHHIMKFTREGDHLLTFGDPFSSLGSNDPQHLGGPAAVHVDLEAGDLYVADGYRNRRVVVLDARTGEYRRHWGAYGNQPDDAYEFGARGVDAPMPSQFSLVHGLVVSRDGLVYVTDRRNNRIQVFDGSGAFLQEKAVRPETLASGTAFTVALSQDAGQELLFLADGTNHKVWVLRRRDLEIVGEFGRGGRQVGEFLRPHNVAVDSRNRVYVGEANPGRRIQRFNPQGGAPDLE